MLFVYIKLCPGCHTYKQTAPLCSPKYLSQHFKQRCSQRLPQALYTVNLPQPPRMACGPSLRKREEPQKGVLKVGMWQKGDKYLYAVSFITQEIWKSRSNETAGAMPAPSSQVLANNTCLTLCHLPDQTQKVRALAHRTPSHQLNPCSAVILPPLIYSKTLLKYLNFNLFYFPWKTSRRTCQQLTVGERSELLTPIPLSVRLHLTWIRCELWLQIHSSGFCVRGLKTSRSRHDCADRRLHLRLASQSQETSITS